MNKLLIVLIAVLLTSTLAMKIKERVSEDGKF
jgi:hypothetical protein